MTGLSRSVTRLTESAMRSRPIVVELHGRYMELRELGCRTKFVLSYEAAFDLAARKAADKTRAEKLAAKKRARQQRREAKAC